MLVDEQALVSYLRDESIIFILDSEREDAPSRPTTRPAMRRMAFPQISAAMVVGVIVGLLNAGVVWAVNSPQSQIRTLRIVNGDFETMSGPVESGFPSQFGIWVGNPAEVIEGSDGGRMLRFLKTGNVNGDSDDPASDCSVFQLVDLLFLRQQWNAADPGSQVTLNLTARFHREIAPTDDELPKLAGIFRIYLFNTKPEAIGAGWPQVIREDGLGFSKRVEIKITPGDETTVISTSCLLESEATVALIVVSASTKYRADLIELGGYFVDDVQLTAIRRPNLPAHYVK